MTFSRRVGTDSVVSPLPLYRRKDPTSGSPDDGSP